MSSRWFTLLSIILIGALFPLSNSAQPAPECPATGPEGATALLDASEACLQYGGPFGERNAARALVYAQDAMTSDLSSADLARAYSLQGEAHFWLQQVGQAIAAQTLALNLEPTADRALWRAVMMDRVGDTAGAMADGQLATTLEPGRTDLYLWLGEYALDHDQSELALDVAGRAAAFASDDPDVVRLEGDAHYALADFAAAKTAYDRYMALAPDPAPVVIARLQIIERRLGS